MIDRYIWAWLSGAQSGEAKGEIWYRSADMSCTMVEIT